MTWPSKMGLLDSISQALCFISRSENPPTHPLIGYLLLPTDMFNVPSTSVIKNLQSVKVFCAYLPCLVTVYECRMNPAVIHTAFSRHHCCYFVRRLFLTTLQTAKHFIRVPISRTILRWWIKWVTQCARKLEWCGTRKSEHRQLSVYPIRWESKLFILNPICPNFCSVCYAKNGGGYVLNISSYHYLWTRVPFTMISITNLKIWAGVVCIMLYWTVEAITWRGSFIPS